MSPHREGQKPKPVMHGGEKSDRAIVAVKLANEARSRAKEQVEPRARAKENAPQDGMPRTPSRSSVSPALERVRQVAKGLKKERFTALLHHVTPELLGFAFFALKREAAPGIDGTTWYDYAQGVERKLEDLHGRVHRGAYRAQPSRRRFIPKPDGRLRPLGIAALEDKIVQRALVEVLNAIYEEDFLGFSYGFRPGRGQHDALDALAVGIDRTQVNWILDADIAGFFDAVDHEWLIRFIELRVGDQRVIRLIRKWLKAGVMEEDGSVSPTEKGTPQGAVISPLLANIYLHYVFDRWAQQWRKRQAQQNVILVRYADDIVVGFAKQEEAESFKAGLHARMAQFALTLHPEKTRLIEFGRHAATKRKARGLGKPETFNFLGFTHICGRSRRGGFLLRRASRRDRMRAKLKAIKEELRRRWHEPVAEQGQWLQQVVRGWFNYHAVPTNIASLSKFHHHLSNIWLRALRRRSQRDKTPWTRMSAVIERWLPSPRITHPWPDQRFNVKHPRWEPYAGKLHVRFCAGGA
jgi:group II intron reverse transcriptase/maturase